MRQIIAISGPVGAGKSAFAEALAQRFPIHRVSTRKYIIAKSGTPDDRAALQAEGARLDEQTHGAWVADAAQEAAADCGKSTILLIDAVRTADQVQKLRDKFGNETVYHVHLTAPDKILETRYLERLPELKEFATYDEVRRSPTESAISELSTTANIVLQTEKSRPESLVTYAFEGRFSAVLLPVANVDVIVGAQYGSEGKGNICSFLAREYQVFMRIGGPNAGHMVAEPYYKYIQLPSGTGSNRDAYILVGAGSTISLPQILKEIMDHPWLLNPGALTIDGQAMVIDDEDRRLEGALLDSIASTKQGVGAATARKIIGRGGTSPFGPSVALARDIPQLERFIGDTKRELDRHYASSRTIMLEGTQGTDLSLHHGKYPKVTSRETSAAGCLSDAGIAPSRVRKVVMVTRTYPIRVGGTSGDMGVELTLDEIAKRSGIPSQEIRDTEKGTVSRRERRIAEFDWEQLRRSTAINGATDIALTFTDYLGFANRGAGSYDGLLKDTQRFVEDIERVSGRPVSLISTNFGKGGIIDRRNWN